MTERAWRPDWNKGRAEATFEEYIAQSRRWKRPNGKAIYELVEVAKNWGSGGYGIRVRRVDGDVAYVICHNSITEEGWVPA